MPVRFSVGVRHQQQYNAMYQPYRLPALLTILDPVLPADVERIIEHKLRRVEAESVLLPVDTVFRLVSNDLHWHSSNVTTV